MDHSISTWADSVRPGKWERVSRERLGSALPEGQIEQRSNGGATTIEVVATPALADSPPDGDPEAEAKAFVRFCYRRRSVEWPELYDEMCAVAARGDYRGMDYEQLRSVGIGFALASLPRLAELAASVIAEERSPARVSAAVA